MANIRAVKLARRLPTALRVARHDSVCSVEMLFHAREKRCLDEVVDDCHSQPRAARHWSTVHQHEILMPFSQIANTFIPLPETPEVGSAANFASSVEDLVTQTLEFTIEEANADVMSLTMRKIAQINLT